MSINPSAYPAQRRNLLTEQSTNFPARKRVRLKVVCRVQIGDVLTERRYTGRLAECLLKLVEAGQSGITVWNFAAGTRVSHSIFELRRAGILIGTELEPNTGQYGGEHARYRLGSHVEIIEREEARI